jgi:hypothetical protein
VRETANYEDLARFYGRMSPEAYRVKGFVTLAKGAIFADCVGRDVQLTPWTGGADYTRSARLPRQKQKGRRGKRPSLY